ncbi:MAG: SRPBCC family protein [Gammaproteobacteria bacterium]
MPSCTLERQVSYSADQMFDLAIDMESYHDFMPLEFGGHIIERGLDTLKASQAIHIGPIRLTFESSASFRRPEWLRVESTSRPFNKFLIAWTFTRMERGCSVRVQVDCTTRSPLLGALLAPWMEIFTRESISAFERRATEIYPQVQAPRDSSE